MAYEYPKFIKQILIKLSKDKRDDIERTMEEINHNLSQWILGQIMISITIGVGAFIAYSLIKLPFALPLAVLAGLLEFVPNLGPTLAAIPAILVALTVSPATVLFTVIAGMLIQTLENNLVVPMIMKRAVQLHPLIVIVGIVTGHALAGLIGAILAVPIITTVNILGKNLMRFK
jgi:predicted PurR-regulated permease PerM